MASTEQLEFTHEPRQGSPTPLGSAASGSIAELEGSEDTWIDGEHQPDRILLGDCAGGFTIAEGVGFDGLNRSRGLAIGDIDRDGRPDALVVGKHFLEHWRGEGGCEGVSVRLEGDAGNREGIGAKIEAVAGGVTTTQWVLPSSTASSSMPERYFGSGGYAALDLTVTWPDGHVSTEDAVPAGSQITIAR